MALRIYNSLTRRKQEFVPQHANQITMYVCGVTVYDYCHLGHARAYVVWDMVRRYLQFRYQGSHQIKYVQNITDIDDKILNRAKERGLSMEELADIYIKAYNEDMKKLNILPADRYPRATEFIPAMIDLIQQLETRGFAYSSKGDVYYAVEKFPSYGKLSGRKLTEMQAGASGRIEETEQKRYPLDFALWKSAKPLEPFWVSPWGNGRPGWHIECSAMVKACLGDTIDIHAGGADLQFPHHENEIAQSEALIDRPLAHYWLHNGFVNIDGEKMSKSLQNFRTLRSLLEVYEPMAIRLFILQSHYRQPIDFTPSAMEAATKAWHNLREALQIKDFFPHWPDAPAEIDGEVLDNFLSAMDDDFNTSIAMAIVYELAKKLRGERNNLTHTGQTDMEPALLLQTWTNLRQILTILGFDVAIPVQAQDAFALSEADIEKLIIDRRQARKAKNYKEGDRIRDYLKGLGVVLVDQPDGTTRWLRESAFS